MRRSRGFFGAFRPVAVGSLTEVFGAGKRPRTAALECPLQGMAAAGRPRIVWFCGFSWPAPGVPHQENTKKDSTFPGFVVYSLLRRADMGLPSSSHSRPHRTTGSFQRLFPPQDPHFDSRYRTRGFPNHGSFSFVCATFGAAPNLCGSIDVGQQARPTRRTLGDGPHDLGSLSRSCRGRGARRSGRCGCRRRRSSAWRPGRQGCRGSSSSAGHPTGRRSC